MHDPTGFQEPLGRASLGQQSPHHASGRQFPQALITPRHPQVRPCQRLIPALWATSSHWPLANLSYWATQSHDRIFARAPETRNHLGSSLEPEAFQSALAASVIPKPLRLLVDILGPSCCCLLWLPPPPSPSLRVHGTQLSKVEGSAPKVSSLRVQP